MKSLLNHMMKYCVKYLKYNQKFNFKIQLFQRLEARSLVKFDQRIMTDSIVMCDVSSRESFLVITSKSVRNIL